VSRVRTASPIADVDRIAREEGIETLEETGEKARRFEAFGRIFDISEVAPGKVGLFSVRSTPKEASGDDSYASAYEGNETHDTLRRLFRRAVVWRDREAVA
jgi:hypothetical protein